uniref:Uncharacterized protein n=1 Tax=Glossina palpalis gambiensis TaxID=67801 RepID=A0A1B0BM07_9MUSC
MNAVGMKYAAYDIFVVSIKRRLSHFSPLTSITVIFLLITHKFHFCSLKRHCREKKRRKKFDENHIQI